MSVNMQTPEILESESLNGSKPKRREVGRMGNEIVYQLEESTSCLDCFKSMPEGSLVTIQTVSAKIKVPVCMYFSKLDSDELKLTGRVDKLYKCSCPSFETGEVKSRENYAKRTREE
jgi:hypothetical protein